MSGWLLENARQSKNPLHSGTSPVGSAVFITISRLKRSGISIGNVRPSRPPQSCTTSVMSEIERADEGEQAVAMEVERIDRIVGRLVGAAETEKVGRDDAAAGRQKMRDHAPVEIAPGRLAVQAKKDRRICRALVEIGHRQAGKAGRSSRLCARQAKPGRSAKRSGGVFRMSVIVRPVWRFLIETSLAGRRHDGLCVAGACRRALCGLRLDDPSLK